MELLPLSFYFQEYGESAQSDREEVLGQKRKEISPGICSNVEQVGKNNKNSSLEASCGRKTKPSSALRLLELLDTIDDHSDCNSKSMSEPDTLWNSCASKKNSSVEYLAKKKQPKLVSMLHRLKTDANSINENDSCRTENIGGVPRDITEKETSVSARSLFQVIANNVENSTQAKRQKVFDGVKNNSISPYSISYMKPERHNTALGAVFKQEASGNDTCVRSVNSLAR